MDKKNTTREKAKGEKVHGPVTTLKFCGCGCGAAVKRHFLPGHDMKLKSTLKKAAKDGNAEAEKELKSKGWT